MKRSKTGIDMIRIAEEADGNREVISCVFG